MHRILRAMALSLDQAARSGEGLDHPEGSVTTTLSHTLARKWADQLRLMAVEVEDHGASSWEIAPELEELIPESQAFLDNAHRAG